MLNKEPLLANASIHDFQGGIAGYVADVVEQALLLPEDKAELRGMRSSSVLKDASLWYVLSLFPQFVFFILFL